MKSVVNALLFILEIIRGIAGVVITLALFAGVGAGLAMAILGNAPEQVKVPKLKGLTVSAAESALGPRGLALRVMAREYNPTVKEDRIIRCRPYEGKRVKRGRAVEVVLSLGPRSVAVPKLSGLTLAAAENRLSDLGLRVSEIRRKAGDLPRDRVLEQYPAAGSKVGRRAGVVLIASGGKSFGLVQGPDGPPWLFRRVRITVPRGAPLQRVQLVLPNAPERQRIAYDRVHRPGDRISVNIVARKGWRVKVRLADKQVFDTKL